MDVSKLPGWQCDDDLDHLDPPSLHLLPVLCEECHGWLWLLIDGWGEQPVTGQSWMCAHGRHFNRARVAGTILNIIKRRTDGHVPPLPAPKDRRGPVVRPGSRIVVPTIDHPPPSPEALERRRLRREQAVQDAIEALREAADRASRADKTKRPE